MNLHEAHHNTEVALGNEARCSKCGVYGKIIQLSPGLFEVYWPSGKSQEAYLRHELRTVRCCASEAAP